MTVIFLGTSNCIIRQGFLHSLEPILDETLKVHAIGASTSAVGCYLLQLHPVAAGDIVFFDYSINENAALLLNVRSRQQIRLQIGTIIQTVLERGGIPVALLLPCHATLEKPSVSETAHREFCEEFGVPTLNVAEVFRKVLAAGIPPTVLMRDRMHSAAKVTPAIAAMILQTVNLMRSAPAVVRRMRVPSRAMRLVHMAELRPDHPTQSYASSIFTGKFQTIAMDDMVEIPLQPGEVLHSMMVNRGAPGAKVSLAGNVTTVKNAVVYWEKGEAAKFQAGLIDFRNDVAAKDGRVSLTLLPWSAKETERTLNAQSPMPDRYGSIEVQAFMVAGPARRLVARSTLPDVGSDLLALIGEADAVRTVSEAATADAA